MNGWPELNQFLIDNRKVDFIENENFRISNSTIIKTGEVKLFKNCTFLIEKTGHLDVEFIEFTECTFLGQYINKSYGDYQNPCCLNFSKFKIFKGNKLTGDFNRIDFVFGEIEGMIDISKVKSIEYSVVKMFNSEIHGWCNKLSLSQFVMDSTSKKKSVWAKEVESEVLIENKTIFKNVLLNPFYLATKCDDKTSLDISRATLVDNWSMLRKEYSGARLYIVFILTILFFLPIITKAFLLIALHNVNSTIELNEIPLWEALFVENRTGWLAFGYFILTLVLILYTIGRFWMTISIAKLKEEESFMRDSGFKLVSIHPKKYLKQIKIHRKLAIMLWISVIYSVIKLVETLLINVPDL